ncbi:MAG: DUF1294 domain-containing protein [Bacteroidaceae bacterium]|nr:DUF1294 domain-containing protein [Bacteroidaceae bacterium]
MGYDALHPIIIFGINVIAFFVYGIDRLNAKKERWCMPESTLLLFTVIGEG